MQPKHTLYVQRTQIPVRLVDNFVCGGVDGQFAMRCWISTRGLTSEGFVVEVKSFIDAVKEAYDPDKHTLKASCEELANGVLTVALKLVGRSRLSEVKVEVENLTGVVQLLWEHGDEVPVFPRKATESEFLETELRQAVSAGRSSQNRC